jgi:RNA polymerase sigma factor (sigma-70 family)
MTDLDALVRRAAGGDVVAFVELTRRFHHQHFAYGSALALLGDFQEAENTAQEAFMAAWSALPSLEDKAAFPGWLRGIVRHQAFRVLRRPRPETLPLSAAEGMAAEEAPPDVRLDERRQAAAVMAAMADLPAALREPATLFYLHECSQQDIATFLGLKVATVNNRLHAARAQLKQRMITMVQNTLESCALPDDFAKRIGRLIEAKGGIVEALFDLTALPDILGELAISDEAHRRGVSVQVIQRPGGGVVRGIATSPMDALPRGATVLSAGRLSEAAVTREAFERSVAILAGKAQSIAAEARLLETGIKVIDMLCPFPAGGTVAIAGTYGVGLTVVMEELVRRLASGRDKISLFVFWPRPSAVWPPSLDPAYSIATELQKDGYSEGTVGSVETFFLRHEDEPWTTDRLVALAPADVVIHLSRGQAQDRIYPTVDPLTSRSRLFETNAVSAEHAAVARRVLEALTALREAGDPPPASAASPALERARKLRRFFGQPFLVAEPYTGRPGVHVSLSETLAACREILDGAHDDLPVDAFVFAGGMAEIRARTAPGSRALRQLRRGCHGRDAGSRSADRPGGRAISSRRDGGKSAIRFPHRRMGRRRDPVRRRRGDPIELCRHLACRILARRTDDHGRFHRLRAVRRRGVRLHHFANLLRDDQPVGNGRACGT